MSPANLAALNQSPTGGAGPIGRRQLGENGGVPVQESDLPLNELVDTYNPDEAAELDRG